MSELVELSNNKHKQFRIKPNCAVEFSASQQIMRLRAVEIGKAVTNFPVFLTRNTHDGSGVLSALTSFDSSSNLYVKDTQWQATYQPTVMQTYPLFLMKSPKDENSYTIGIDEQSSAFSRDNGEALFDEGGKASLYLSRVKTLLEADIKNDIHTYQFIHKLQELELLKGIDLLVHYQDASVQTLTGLNTIDEDKLHALSAEQLYELNQQGYLVPIHAMLVSIYQLNLLVRYHNAMIGNRKVTQVKLEVAKDR
jgi:hypothetical protein